MSSVTGRSSLEQEANASHRATLLSLPAEVRAIIWEHCLGLRNVHIKRNYWHPSFKVKHTICRAEISDFASYEDFDGPTDPTVGTSTYPSFRPVCTQRILPPGQPSLAEWKESFLNSPCGSNCCRGQGVERCRTHFQTRNEWRKTYQARHSKCWSPESRLSLSMMRTSRLVYTETFFTLWACNTFSFSGYDLFVTFAPFIHGRTDAQRGMLRHLALNIETPNEWTTINPLEKPFRPPCTLDTVNSMLAGLHSMYLEAGVVLTEDVLGPFFCHGVLMKGINMPLLNVLRKGQNLRTFSIRLHPFFMQGGKKHPIYLDGFDKHACLRDLNKALSCKVLAEQQMEDQGEGGLEVQLELSDKVLRERSEEWSRMLSKGLGFGIDNDSGGDSSGGESDLYG